MAAINAIAKEWADEIRDGIAWMIVWKIGRSWNATAVWLDFDTDTFKPEDLELAREILEKDPKAIMINGYYCGHFGEDMTVAELAAGIRWHYENGYNMLDGSTAFPAESTECPTDLSWYGKTTSNAELDPYVYNDDMSLEEYEVIHKNMDLDQQQEKDTYATYGTLCIDRQNFAEAITEPMLPHLSPPKMNFPDLRSPPIMDLTLTITPDTAAAVINIVQQSLLHFFESIVKTAREAWAQLKKAVKEVSKCIGRIAGKCMDIILYNANDHPKWWHLYKHAKKRRTHKKYRRLLMQQLTRKLAAAFG